MNETANSVTPDTNANELLGAVFRTWQKAGLDWLVLRNYEDLPETLPHDIDLLVSPRHLHRAEHLLISTAGSLGFRQHNRAEFASIVCCLSNVAGQQVVFDFYPDLKWRGFDFLDADGLIAGRIQRGTFPVPSPAHEGCALFMERLIFTGRVKEEYRPKIAATFQHEPAVARSLLARSYGGKLAQFLVEHAAREDWRALETAAGKLRKALILRQCTRRPLRTLAAQIQDAARLIGRAFCPVGFTVALLGADGSGKSTVARKIIEDLAATFSPGKGLHCHWKPRVFGPGRLNERKAVTDPHGRPPRGTLASLAYFAFHWLEFVLGTRLKFWPARFRGGLVLVERHYYDFFVDQRRYRLQVTQWLVRLAGVFVKKPGLVILLDAPPEVLQARKAEVSLAETTRQREAYRKLVAGLANGVVIDAAQPVDKVAADAVRAILDRMILRMHRRSKCGASVCGAGGVGS